MHTATRRIVLVLFLLLTGVVPSFGQGFGQGPNRECSPAGTWYGGAENSAKYLLTVVATEPGHYSVVYDQGFTPAIPKLSPFVGRLAQVRHGGLVGQVIALANLSAVPPPQGGPNPQIWAAREFGHMVDCDTLEFEIDFYGVYAWGKVPFVDPPDGSRLPPSGVIRETYLRMPIQCEVCPQ